MGEMTAEVPAVPAGRDDRLATLYRAESARVVSLAYLLTGQRQLAEDLAQEAFLRVASRLRDVNPDAFPAYLRQTVVNLVRSYHRHARVQRRYADRVEADAHAAARRGGSVVGIERRGRRVHELWAALQSLPVRQREAIVCRFYLDMSEDQAAVALGVPVGTVKSATSRGLASMRAALGSEQP